MYHTRPDQIVRSQHLERSGHLAAVEKALFPHHVFEKRNLAFVIKKHQFTCLGEIGLRSKQGDGCEPIVPIPRHGGGGDWLLMSFNLQ